MRQKSRLLCSAILLTGLLVAGVGLIQGQQVGGKTIQMKLLLPRADSKFYVDTKVYVDGKEIAGQGYDRILIVNTAKDKDYVEVVAKWEPNNYTKIERPRKVKAKEGNGLIVVDFRDKSNTEKDDIKVRWVPTPDDVVDAMCQMAKVGKNDVVYDLGCGDGIMVVIALKKFDALRGVGIDLDPEMVKKSKIKAQEYGVANKVEFRVGDVLKVDDLSDATVVLLYMGDYINQRLQPHIRSTSNPGYECDIHLWEIKKK
jgi:SAM-dependent methyltransferase